MIFNMKETNKEIAKLNPEKIDTIALMNKHGYEGKEIIENEKLLKLYKPTLIEKAIIIKNYLINEYQIATDNYHSTFPISYEQSYLYCLEGSITKDDLKKANYYLGILKLIKASQLYDESKQEKKEEKMRLKKEREAEKERKKTEKDEQFISNLREQL